MTTMQFKIILSVFFTSFLLGVHTTPQFFTTLCDSYVNCTAIKGSSCIRDEANNVSKCACDDALEYVQKTSPDEYCELQVPINEVCSDDKFSVCKAANSECREEGALSSINRCQCMEGYVSVTESGVYSCYKKVTKKDKPDCTDCENNDGICYEISDGTTKCKCPASRSGDDCSKIHVNVTCDISKKTMEICYEPHSDVNPAQAAMYTAGYGDSEACLGKLLNNDTAACKAGFFLLKLSIAKEDLKKCGLEVFLFDTNLQREFASIIVKRFDEDTFPLKFATFCEVQTYAVVHSGALPAYGEDMNNRGDTKTPTLSMSVYNALGTPIDPTQAVRVGDKIRFMIRLLLDGTYTALNVKQCMVSSSPRLPDSKAITMMLIQNGCPAPGQPIFFANNTFKHVGNTKNEVETKFLSMFKLAKGNSIYLHCTVGLCVGGYNDNCEQRPCSDGDNTATGGGAGTGTNTGDNTATGGGDGTGTNTGDNTATGGGDGTGTNTGDNTATGGGDGTGGDAATGAGDAGAAGTGNRKKRATRKKREADVLENSTVTQEIIWWDSNSKNADKVNLSSEQFIGLMVFVAIVLLLLVIASVVLLWKLKERSKLQPDQKMILSERPQQFAQPRNNNNLRI